MQELPVISKFADARPSQRHFNKTNILSLPQKLLNFCMEDLSSWSSNKRIERASLRNARSLKESNPRTEFGYIGLTVTKFVVCSLPRIFVHILNG